MSILTLILNVVLWLAAIYLLIGLVFAIYFVWRGAAQIDESAQNISWVLRLMLLPASIAFWIILLPKVLKRS